MRIQSFLPSNSINCSRKIRPNFKGEWEQKGITADGYDSIEHAKRMAEIEAEKQLQEAYRRKKMAPIVKDTLARLAASLMVASACTCTYCKLDSMKAPTEEEIRYFELEERPRIINHSIFAFTKGEDDKNDILNIDNRIFIESENTTTKEPLLAFDGVDTHSVIMGAGIVEYVLNIKSGEEELFINGNKIESVPSISGRRSEKPLHIIIHDDGSVEAKGNN